MRKVFSFILFVVISVNLFAQENDISFYPVNHATIVITANGKTIFVDPVGSDTLFAQFADPDIILITDIHFDHMNPEIVANLRKENTIVVGPYAVAEKVENIKILNNGEKEIFSEIEIEAIAAYNLTEERLNFHPKGRGNGYVINLAGKRIYLSGDTEDVPEMRALKNIDQAFVCMNLPWTMDINQAASAILEFKPKVVTPYHYKGKEGMSDLEKFKDHVSANEAIEVELMNFYK